MTDPLKIYLSYAPAERELAIQLASRLSEEGFDVWAADEKLFPSDNWLLQTGKALEQSNVMIVLLSPDYVASPWTKQQVIFGLGSEKYSFRIIPVLVRPTKEVPWVLESMKIIKSHGRWDRVAEKIIKRLRQVVEVSS